MRLLLFTGKGGVGKTTTAAATAVHAARRGVKTLVASADSAHSLADALGVRLGPSPVEIEPGLSGLQIDARARAERSWRRLQDYLTGALDALGVDPLAAEELTELPGAADVLALLEVRDQVQSGPWDLLVLDCAPSAETVRMLAMPELLTRTLHRMLPMERRISRILGRGLRPVLGSSGIPLPADDVVLAAEQLAAELAAASDVLGSADTSVRLVLTPDEVVLAETRRTWTALALHGFTVDVVIANRVFDPAAGDAWRRGWGRAQQRVLADAADSFAGARLLRCGFAEAEPVGVDALAALAEDLYGAGPAAAGSIVDPPPAARGLVVDREGSGFVLRLDLPLATREEVELGRIGDELVVTVRGGSRRILALPSGLRRCRVVGAVLRDGRLGVRFEPDPALWRPA